MRDRTATMIGGPLAGLQIAAPGRAYQYTDDDGESVIYLLYELPGGHLVGCPESWRVPEQQIIQTLIASYVGSVTRWSYKH